MLFKKILRRFFYSLGFEIHKTSKNDDSDDNCARVSISQSYTLLKKLNFHPKTIIDAGVAKGTPELYDAFPESNYLLIEALKEFEADLIKVLKTIKGSYVLAAAGKAEGEISFNIHTDHLEGSSSYEETMGKEADGIKVTVPMVRIDCLVQEKKLQGPFLIKIDVQGAEIDVLEGCTGILKETEVIVLEVSMFEFMKGAPQFFEIITYMKSQGFVAYDIIHGWNRPLDGALGQVDIVFVKENGQFRLDHSYSQNHVMETI